MTAMRLLWYSVLVAGVAACRSGTPTELLAPARLIVIGPVDSIEIGTSVTLQLTAVDASGNPVPAPVVTAVTWTSSDTAVATVSTSGSLTAIGVGSVTISARFGALTGSALVHVRDAVSVEILSGDDWPGAGWPDSSFNGMTGRPLLAPGQSVQLTAVEYFTHTGFTRTPAKVTWSSNDASIATVSARGVTTSVVTGVAPGVVTITANIDQYVVQEPMQVQQTPGTATIRMIDATLLVPSVTMHPNSGTPVTLSYGAISKQTIAAGSLQLLLDTIPPVPSGRYGYDPSNFDLKVFYGLVPAGTHQTFVAISSYPPVVIAWLSDRSDPVPADSAVVRVVMAAGGRFGFNVYFTSPGAPMSVLALQGCYLDWPFGYTAYADRVPGNFDIVLQGGKGLNGPEVARFPETPAAGHAMTYIITGKDTTSLNVLPVVDE